MMRYLVTGADGFLGRHFLARLTELGIPAVAMLHPDMPEAHLPGEPTQVRADLLDRDSLRPAVEGVSHIIHLAARVHMMHDPAPDPEAAFHAVNVTGTENLFTVAADAGVAKFLLMSSVKAMGEEEVGVFDETSPCRPAGPYGRSKLAAEQLIFEMSARRSTDAVVLRLPMVYGPGQKGNMLRLLDAAARGKKLPLGRIHNKRSMVYVGNVVDAALACIQSEAGAGEVFLVCDERPYSTKELYATIAEATSGQPMLRNVPVAALKLMGLVGSVAEAMLRRDMPVNRAVIQRLTGDLFFDDSKIHSRVGFTPSVGLDEGIARTVQWYQDGCPLHPPG